MLVVNYSNARENFKTYCDKANDDFEIIIITRKQGGNVVMISESEYNNMLENIMSVVIKRPIIGLWNQLSK